MDLIRGNVTKSEGCICMQALFHLQRSKSPRGNLVWLKTPVSPILTLDALLSFKPDLFSNEPLLLFKLTRAFFTQPYYLEQR